jgi:long-chain acyl-CoA synthetase
LYRLFVREWANRKGYELGDSNEELISNSHVKERMQKEVDLYNAFFGNWEQLKKFVLLPNELSIEKNELTPTLKLKRKVIMEKYADAIERIYAERD